MLQPAGQCDFVVVFDGCQLTQYFLVLCKSSEFLQLGGIFFEPGADKALNESGEFRITFEKPSAEGDTIGFIIKFFRVKSVKMA